MILLYVTRRGTTPVRAPEWLPTPMRARFRRNIAMIKDVAERGVQVAEAGGDAELVKLLLDAHDPVTGEKLTRQAVIDELLVFLLAGHDTTATTLAYTLWQLGHHLDLQERVYDEVAHLDPSAINDATMREIPETMKVLHESLRLSHPLLRPGDLRPVTSRSTAFESWPVRRSSSASTPYTVTPAIWGPDAAEFRPDRFDEPEGAHKNRWAFLPFGGGHRSCIGDHFAMTEAVIASSDWCSGCSSGRSSPTSRSRCPSR